MTAIQPGEPCYVRRVFKVREQGRDIYVQTSEWFAPWINPETGLRELRIESHPEWNTEELRAGDYETVIERRPWINNVVTFPRRTA